MQIILIQSEVEQAIKDYVSTNLTIADNTEFTIDLSPTRGSEGIKAIIDLVQADATSKAPTTTKRHRQPAQTQAADSSATPAPAAKPSAIASLSRLKATSTATPATTEEAPVVGATVPAAAPEPEAEPAQQEDPAEVQEAAEQEPTAEPEVTEEQEPVAAEPPPTPPVRSLFANLKKPQNG